MSYCILDHRQPNNAQLTLLGVLTPRRVKSSLQYAARSSVIHHVHHVLGSPPLIAERRRPRMTSILRLQPPIQGRLHALVRRFRFFPSHGSGSHMLPCLSSSCIGINGSGNRRRKYCEAHWRSESMEIDRSTHDQQVATCDLSCRVYEQRCHLWATAPILWVPVRLQIMSSLKPRYQGFSEPQYSSPFVVLPHSHHFVAECRESELVRRVSGRRTPHRPLVTHLEEVLKQ